MGQNVEANIAIIFFITILMVNDNFDFSSLAVNSQTQFSLPWPVVSSGSDTIESSGLNSF